MAQVVLSSGSICRPFRSPWGAFPTRTFLLPSTTGAVQTGRPMTLNIAASTDVATAIPVAANAPAYFSIIGIAAGSQAALTSSAVTGPELSVWECNPLVEFRAATKGGALASSNVGLRKSLVFDSTLNIAWVDLSASTATDWRVLITQNLGTLGDSGGEVAFRFLTHGAEQWNSTIASSTPILAFYS